MFVDWRGGEREERTVVGGLTGQMEGNGELVEKVVQI